MSELTPETRTENFWVNEGDLEPITRKEQYIKHLYDETQVVPDHPLTREEYFINKAGEELHDVTVEQLSVTENGTYSEAGKAYSPVIVEVPLPANAYLKKTATTSMSDAVRLPVASAVVSVTDKDKAELFLTTDGVVSEDNTPYTYRQSPSGKSCVDLSVVGGTVAWNQIVENGNFASTSGWLVQNSSISVSDNVATVTSNTSYTEANIVRTNIGIVKDHIYIISSEAKSDSEVLYKYSIYGAGSGTQIFSLGNLTNNFAKYQKLVKADGDKGNFYLLITKSQASDLVVMNYKNVNIIDLTQMFGSTIADYIYSLESGTAGSGIAWLKSYGFLTKDYYSYDAGSLQSVNTSGRKIVGKNLLDVSKLEQGGISADGTEFNNPSFSQYRRTPYIYLPAGSYIITRKTATDWWKCYLYDMGKSPIGTTYYFNKGNTLSESITLDRNCYIRFAFDYTPTSEDEIQLEVGSTVTSYEPYKSKTYPLDSDLTLRGIPKLDANNNLYYDGDTYESDGSVTRKYGVVDLGSLSWETRGTGVTGKSRFVATLTGAIPSDLTNGAKSICDKYGLLINGGTYNATDNGYTLSTNAINMYVEQYSTSTAETFKTAMNGIYLVYELATPTSESADAFATPQIVNPKGTEEYVDYAESQGTRDVAIPVGQDSKYVNGNIYIKYLDSVTTGDIELTDENAIIPLENTTYISSNGSASIDYWSKEV